MNFDKISDERLAFYMQQNDGRGIEALIERYQEPLIRYLNRLVGDAELAEDAVQNTFISVYKNINSYNPKQKLSPWIYRIAHNKAINELRTHKHHGSLDEAKDLSDPKDAVEISNSLDKMALRQLLDKHIDNLPVKYKEPLILRFFEERSYEEISDILRIPKSTVGVRIKRGIEKLKIKVDPKLKEYL